MFRISACSTFPLARTIFTNTAHPINRGFKSAPPNNLGLAKPHSEKYSSYSFGLFSSLFTLSALSFLTANFAANRQTKQSPNLNPLLSSVLPSNISADNVISTLSDGHYWRRNDVGPVYYPTTTDNTCKSPRPIHLQSGTCQDPASVSAAYIGGLRSLINACMSLSENPDKSVVYICDGERKIADNAGLQLHPHPTQYTDYTVMAWMEALCRSNGLLPPENPSKMNYSSLHFRLESLEDTLTLAKFGLHMLVRNCSPSTKDNISNDDRRLVQEIKSSIATLKKLDAVIFETTGKHIISQRGRYYWSDNKEDLAVKKRLWNNLGIGAEFVDEATLVQHTLIKPGSGLIGLYLPEDGEVSPHMAAIVIEFLEKKYPKTFTYIPAKVTAIRSDMADTINTTKGTSKVSYTNAAGVPGSVIAERAVLSSGHDQVMVEGKQLYQSIPIAAVSANFTCTVPRDVLMEKIPESVSLSQFIANGGLLPSADLYNLHVKVLPEYTENEDGSITLFVRVTEGGNVGRWTADLHDLENILYKLTEKFSGKWTLQTLGSCARQGGVSNAGSVHSYGGVKIVADQAGVGISLSGTRV